MTKVGGQVRNDVLDLATNMGGHHRREKSALPTNVWLDKRPLR